MDQIINKIVRLFTESKDIKIASIILTGSKVNGLELDFWSDTDIVIILQPEEKIFKEKIEHIIFKLGQVIGKEEYTSSDTLTQRLIININGLIEKTDIKIYTYSAWIYQNSNIVNEYKLLYGDELKFEIKDQKSLIKTDEIKEPVNKINQIWFLFFECVKKFMRNDNLIGLHLLLELIQEFLVLKMNERDLEYKTHIHKKGYKEELPNEINLNQINYQNKREILDYIKNLSIQIDNQMKKQLEGYQSRAVVFTKYLRESEQNIKA